MNHEATHTALAIDESPERMSQVDNLSGNPLQLRSAPAIIVTRLDGVLGLYDKTIHTVFLDDRLDSTERRCTLMHELIHAERGDTALADPVLNARQERIVHREAARRLIPIDALIAAYAFSSAHQSVAEELEVDNHTLQVRLQNLTTLERQKCREAGIQVSYPLPRRKPLQPKRRTR